MRRSKVRSSSVGTSFSFWGKAKGAEIIRRVVLVSLLVGGLILAFLSQTIRIAAKTQQDLPDDEIPRDIKYYCEYVGKSYNICPELLEALAFSESRFKPEVKNRDCWGLMQINVKIHKDRINNLGYKKEDMLDPYKNLVVAADILSELYEKYEDENPIILMIYAGQYNAVKRYKKNGQVTEYVKDVLTRSEKYERLHGK